MPQKIGRSSHKLSLPPARRKVIVFLVMGVLLASSIRTASAQTSSSPKQTEQDELRHKKQQEQLQEQRVREQEQAQRQQQERELQRQREQDEAHRSQQQRELQQQRLHQQEQAQRQQEERELQQQREQDEARRLQQQRELQQQRLLQQEQAQRSHIGIPARPTQGATGAATPLRDPVNPSPSRNAQTPVIMTTPQSVVSSKPATPQAPAVMTVMPHATAGASSAVLDSGGNDLTHSLLNASPAAQVIAGDQWSAEAAMAAPGTGIPAGEPVPKPISGQAGCARWADETAVITAYGDQALFVSGNVVSGIVDASGAPSLDGSFLRLENRGDSKLPFYFGFGDQADKSLAPGQRVTVPVTSPVVAGKREQRLRVRYCKLPFAQ